MSNDPSQPIESTDPPDNAPAETLQLEQSTYEIIQNRLASFSADLQQRLNQLNEKRRNVFGSIPTELISTQRITTDNNCTSRDIVPIGNRFLFGYNVHIGLKATTELADVFSIYRLGDNDQFHKDELDALQNPNFLHDFDQLYKYYKDTRFVKFHVIGPHLYMVFQVGKTINDIKAFKFLINEEQLTYVDGRSEHEAKFPAQHDFKWLRTHRDLHRSGEHPHISIADRVFVETIGGDLTIKIEDNTDDGEGIYSEPVTDPDQTLDDAEIYYAVVGNIILLKIRPFKEETFRYFVFNEKKNQAIRLDSIEDACVQLPEDHGLIFSNGYYLQTGQYKAFDSNLDQLLYEKRIASPNGEDYLYVFYRRQSGHYVLLSYNMIEQKVATPIICNGYSLFDNGHLIFYKSDESPQKHHAIQIWQTPYVGDQHQSTEKTDSYIFKIGNRDIVRAMSESHELINLIDQEDSYANLYVDILKKSTDIIDSYFWLNNEQAFDLASPISDIQAAATAAVDEFDKVVRVRKNTREQFSTTSKAAREAISSAASRQKRTINDYVESLAELRLVRGQVISLKDLKYIDAALVDQIEQEIATNTERLSRACVEFLLRKDSLEPYIQRVDQQRKQIDHLETGMQCKQLEAEIEETAKQLEMLIEIVSNLKIDDATQRTQIIDNISAIYSGLNQTRASLKKKTQGLLIHEGAAEFNSQLKLLSQAVINYMDVCDTPERCDEYLTKMMVQIEEIEGRFAEFDEYVVQLADKREEIYAAFDGKKLQLSEARNRRATALMAAADRILKGIQSRIANFETVDEINSYFAADLMIDKVRDITGKLDDLEESVKVDDVQSRLKTIREDAVRQLRDKNELFVDGQNVIQFGAFNFSVNVQPLDLTTVLKDDTLFFHLSGTNFFEPVEDQALLATVDVWDQSVISENEDVYRAEFLAFKIWQAAQLRSFQSTKKLLQMDPEPLVQSVQQFMAPRYSEGYVKGVHDHDAALILAQLLKLDQNLDLLKYSPDARALAGIFWYASQGSEFRKRISAQLGGLAAARKLFGDSIERNVYVDEMTSQVETVCAEIETIPGQLGPFSANYLFDKLTGANIETCSQPAKDICSKFNGFLKTKKADAKFEEIRKAKTISPSQRFLLIHQWVDSFIRQIDQEDWMPFVNEAAVMLLDGSGKSRHAVDVSSKTVISGMLGDHPQVDGNSYTLDYHDFTVRLNQFETETVPAFETYHELKSRVTDERRQSLRLEEFKPRVLTSFVRNKLINDVYLPMVGANLAKQMGVVGEQKRTDLMGLLLLISPPGYGKTTLMEYIANRLGITFMKINGPAIGHQVTSLDPSEAPNASAREEIVKLNLSLEMGDNVMIYLDDIQHCNPEFLQKFISLCDATRRIEGVFRGRTRTYDLRGRKVCVVMAGNPYTESGEKFQIPDMLSNRADTYNLGDVIGNSQVAFELSYLENCLTSNPVLNRLNSQSRNDIYTVFKMASQTEETVTSLEGNYSIEEIDEFVAVVRKLITVRDVVLRVNREYIDSAAQADDYRTEPPFKLQGSYRDMNKIAERVAAIMNDEELETLIIGHYENQAQTLTTGAEANMLKFREITGKLDGQNLERWQDIKRTFKRNLLLGSAGQDDQMGQVIAQMTTFSEGLYDIRKSLDQGIQHFAADDDSDEESLQSVTIQEVGRAVAELEKFNQSLDDIKNLVARNMDSKSELIEAEPINHKIEVVNKIPAAFLGVLRNQFRVLQTWMEPILALAETLPQAEGLKSAAKSTEKHYKHVLKKIEAIDDPQLTTDDQIDDVEED